MIEERINENLRELENGLNNLESARSQVERTVRAHNELQSNLQTYTQTLDQVTNLVHNLAGTIGQDYKDRVSEFEKDRSTIIESANSIVDKLNDEYKTIWKKMAKRQVLVVTINILLFLAVLLILLKQFL